MRPTRIPQIFIKKHSKDDKQSPNQIEDSNSLISNFLKCVRELIIIKNQEERE